MSQFATLSDLQTKIPQTRLEKHDYLAALRALLVGDNKDSDQKAIQPINNSDDAGSPDTVAYSQPHHHDDDAASHRDPMAGIGLPTSSGIMGRVQQRGFFVPTACSMAGRGRGQQCPPMLLSVDQPEPDRHPLIGLGGRRDATRHSSNIMSTSIPTGESRPLSDRIQPALILAESATALLATRDHANIGTAASALLEAGLTLLGQSSARIFMLTDEHHSEIFDALMTSTLALKLVLRDEESDTDGAAHAVVQLVHDALHTVWNGIDSTPMSRAGMVVEIRSWEADSNG